MNKEIRGRSDIWQKIRAGSVLTIIFVAMLFLLLFYENLISLYPGLKPLLMLFSQIPGLILLGLMIFCISGLAMMIIRRLHPPER